MSGHIKHSRMLTSHGVIALSETGRGPTTLVFIHGNSSCRTIFRHQLAGPLARRCRLLAFDLPGHGDSADAADPERTYTLPGLADAVIELLQLLNIPNPIIFGWSLGGHIAIEMTARFPGLRGLMICGTPPVAPGDAALGFRQAGHGRLAAKRDLAPGEVIDFACGMVGSQVEPFLLDAITRCDGRARETLFRARGAGVGMDQRRAVEQNTKLPLAVVNGAEDAFINLDYLDGIDYANLWEGRCHRLPGLGHAPFWNDPEVFNPLLERFVLSVSAP